TQQYSSTSQAGDSILPMHDDWRHFLLQLQGVCTVRKSIFTEDFLASSFLGGTPRNNFQSIDELQVVCTVRKSIFTEDFLACSDLDGNPTDNFPSIDE
ncbi:MAG: hypothetical protein SFY80_14040, partial [Verrucomicrobiota bacterium]|nr:hypothetical protein [Verrucomicrobiota bacterium]